MWTFLTAQQKSLLCLNTRLPGVRRPNTLQLCESVCPASPPDPLHFLYWSSSHLPHTCHLQLRSTPHWPTHSQSAAAPPQVNMSFIPFNPNCTSKSLQENVQEVCFACVLDLLGVGEPLLLSPTEQAVQLMWHEFVFFSTWCIWIWINSNYLMATGKNEVSLFMS